MRIRRNSRNQTFEQNNVIKIRRNGMGRKKKKLEIRSGVEGKVCKLCNIWKPSLEFNKDKYGVGGLQHKCRECQSTVFKKYYVENEDDLKGKKREYYHNNREARNAYDRMYYVNNQDKIIKYRE